MQACYKEPEHSYRLSPPCLRLFLLVPTTAPGQSCAYPRSEVQGGDSRLVNSQVIWNRLSDRLSACS